jgi:hypothetical protein
VDIVLKGSAGGAGELHGIKAKLLRGLSWSEKERGELTTAQRSAAEGEHGGDPVETKSRKANNGRASRYKLSKGSSWSCCGVKKWHGMQ